MAPAAPSIASSAALPPPLRPRLARPLSLTPSRLLALPLLLRLPPTSHVGRDRFLVRRRRIRIHHRPASPQHLVASALSLPRAAEALVQSDLTRRPYEVLSDDVDPHGDPTFAGVALELSEHRYDRLAKIVIGAKVQSDIRNHRDAVWCRRKDLDRRGQVGALARGGAAILFCFVGRFVLLSNFTTDRRALRGAREMYL